MRTVAQWIADACRQFEAAGLAFGHGTDNAFDEAAWVVLAGAGLAVHDLDGNAQRRLDSRTGASVQALIDARIRTRKPVAYLTGEAWFAGLPFTVDERVIVPRSYFAEVIPEGFSPWLEPARVRRVLDLCTGSGCIAIVLALRFPDAEVDAVDLSDDALAVASLNLQRHNVEHRVRLIQSDLFAALEARQYDLIVTNPPYVREDVMKTLPREYRLEPSMALAGGVDGCALAARIVEEAARHLRPGGVLAMEVGGNRQSMTRRFPHLAMDWVRTADGETPLFVARREAIVRNHRPPPERRQR